MKIRSKPVRPKVKPKLRIEEDFCGTSVNKLAKLIPETLWDMDCINGYDGVIEVCFERRETPAEYQVRLKTYFKKLETYTKWYEENSVEIEEEIKKREKVKEESATNEEKRLEARLAKLRRLREKK